MTSIITGDIIDSSKLSDPQEWLIPMKDFLNEKVGKEPKCWEIYRGDSFQFETKPAAAFKLAISIKAMLMREVNIDARISIGVGSALHSRDRISESTGEAFLYSGHAFEMLRDEKRTLAFSSPWADLNEEINLFFTFIDLITQSWSQASAEIVNAAMDDADFTQAGLAGILGISQPSVSTRMQRARLHEITAFNKYFEKKISRYTGLL
jgi:hypothetical protein